MNPGSFGQLTPQEREDLALCGVSSEEQLRKSSPLRLCKDLEQARRFFPDRSFQLTEHRILELFSLSPDDTIAVDKNDDFGGRSSKPTTGFRHRSGRSRTNSHRNEGGHPVIMHSPVRCTHSFTAFLAAFCTLFLLIPLASVVVLPYLMITDQMPDIPLELLATIVLVVPCAVYMFVARRATCPVCHMRIFRYNHYIRNRAAHHLPILGYNFATALHVLLFWSYNCPGCGTPIKLLGAKGHRTQC